MPDRPVEYERDELAEDIDYPGAVTAGSDGARSGAIGARMAQSPQGRG